MTLMIENVVNLNSCYRNDRFTKQQKPGWKHLTIRHRVSISNTTGSEVVMKTS